MVASLFCFENVYRAWLDCRRNKRTKQPALRFEMNAEENLLALARELADRTYRPRPSFCFVAKNDKHREVFAAQFRDRVVHHLLVRELEKIWEPIFIHDSYACRRGKGTHAAVKRLQTFMRRATANGTRRAWFAQLDIRAFFPSIDRGILLGQILDRLRDEELRWLAELLILHDPSVDPVFTCSKEKWKAVPPYKSLFSVAEGKGLPIGNLTSQFFANIYLNPLDQFIKHTLRVRHYVRYVDDLVLVHEDRGELEDWRERIRSFLESSLALELHPHRRKILPVSNGADFLGYVIRPSHLLVRRRIVRRFREAVARHDREMIRRGPGGARILFPAWRYEKLFSTVQSYRGAFSKASSRRLMQSLWADLEILPFLFSWRRDGLKRRWNFPGCARDLPAQYRHFRRQFGGVLLCQVGKYYEMFDRDAVWAGYCLGMVRIQPRRGFYARCGSHAMFQGRLIYAIQKEKRDLMVVGQTGQQRSCLKDRRAFLALFPSAPGQTRQVGRGW